jgi:hypothetical protein
MVLHQSTTWFTHHAWDGRADLRNSEATAHSFSNSSSSSATLLSLCSSREQLGHHSRSHQWVTRATTVGRLGTLLRNAAYQDKPTHHVPTGEEVLAGTFFLNEHPIIILFDSRASHDFINSTCAEIARLTPVVSSAPYVISTPEVEWIPTV